MISGPSSFKLSKELVASPGSAFPEDSGFAEFEVSGLAGEELSGLSEEHPAKNTHDERPRSRLQFCFNMTISPVDVAELETHDTHTRTHDRNLVVSRSPYCFEGVIIHLTNFSSENHAKNRKKSWVVPQCVLSHNESPVSSYPPKGPPCDSLLTLSLY